MWVCPRCGISNREEGKFCDNCAQPRLARTFDQAMSASAPRIPANRIRDAIKERSETDRRVSDGWVLLAVLGFWASGGIYVVVLFIYLGSLLHIDFGDTSENLYEWFYLYSRFIAMTLFGAFFTVLAYKFLNRLNLHNKREEDLRASVMAYLKMSPRPPNSDPEIVDQLISLSAFDGQAMVYEKRLDAQKWAYGTGLILFLAGFTGLLGSWITMRMFSDSFNSFDLWPFEFAFQMASSVLSLVGLVALIALASHLMKTIYTHSVRWRGFSNSTIIAMRKLGMPMKIPAVNDPNKERSLVIYAVATIVTLGLFGFYWLHVLIKDPQRHFEDQHPFEDQLLAAIE